MPGSPFTKGSTTLAGFNKGEGNIGYVKPSKRFTYSWRDDYAADKELEAAEFKLGKTFVEPNGFVNMTEKNWKEAMRERDYAAHMASQAQQPVKNSGVTQRTLANFIAGRQSAAAARRSRRSRRTRRTRRTRRSRN